MLRALSVLIASRRRVVAIGMASVLAVGGGWILGSDENETRVAAGTTDVPGPLPDTTAPLFPGSDPGVADTSSTSTGPAALVGSGPGGPSTIDSSPTTAPTSPAPAEEPSTTTSTTPSPGTDTVIDTGVPPPDPYCGLPLVGPVAEPGPRPTGWRTMAAAPIAARMRHGAVWTGREMVVWGGANGDYDRWKDFNDGAAYDPATGTWRVLPAAPLKARSMPALVWTGNEVAVFGGVVAGEALTGAAAYNPATNCWRTIADYPLSHSTGLTGFGAVAAAWIADRVLVWNGVEVAAWDPAADKWERFAGPANAAACPKYGGWAGDRLFVWWSVDAFCGDKAQAAAVFDPASHSWTSVTAPTGGTLITGYVPTVWTGDELLVPGVTNGEPRTTVRFAFDLSSGQWRSLPQPSYFEPWQTATWTGTEMLLWGGIPGGPPNTYAYEAAANRWRSAPSAPFTGRHGHTAVWTGTEMIVWGGQGGDKLAWGDGGTYRP